MSQSTANSEWNLNPGTIYQQELHKRVDERPAETAAVLQRASLEGSELVFASSASRDQALEDGVFLLSIPESINFEACDRFARQFYTGNEHLPYGRYRLLTSDRFGDELLGYHERINQIEQFLLERRF